MGTTYFKNGNCYLVVTDESPEAFKGVLFIGKGGTSPESVTEQLYARNQLQRFERVDRDDVPDEWLIAFGEEPPTEVVEEPIFDLSGTELLDLAPVRVRRRQPAYQQPQQQAAPWAWPVGMALGIIIGLTWILLSRIW
jgi:hypothetical protein